MILGDNLDSKKLLGLILIILGVLFVVYPLVSAAAVSMVAGVCLIAFGVACIANGFSLWSIVTHTSLIEMLLGLLLVLLGFCFLVNLAALEFLVSYSFYFIAFILIFLGILGLLSKVSGISKWASILLLIIGVIFLLLAVFAITDPWFIAILVGVCLMVRGVILFTLGSAVDEIENSI